MATTITSLGTVRWFASEFSVPSSRSPSSFAGTITDVVNVVVTVAVSRAHRDKSG